MIMKRSSQGTWLIPCGLLLACGNQAMPIGEHGPGDPGGNHTAASGGASTGEGGGGAGASGAGVGAGAGVGTGAGAAAGGAVGAGGSAPCAPPAVEMPQLRLTRDEYVNTVHDLLGVDVDPDLLPPDLRAARDFRTQLEGPSSVATELAYADAAAAAAAGAVERIDALLGCDLATADELTCVTEFIRSFGGRAFRRPLTEAQLAELRDHYAGEREGATIEEAFQSLLTKMLSSPSFVEHTFTGTSEGAAILLDGHSIAARLSYFIWRSAPDAELFELAADGLLNSANAVEVQARRLLADPRAARGVDGFSYDFLEVERALGHVVSSSEFPLIDDIQPYVAQEAQTFFREQVLSQQGTTQSLLTAPVSFINAALAQVYDVPAPGGDDELVQVALNAEQRAGLLTQPLRLLDGSWETHGSPTDRGHWVRERLLCNAMPPAPQGVDRAFPGGVVTTTRALYEAHMGESACRSCHVFMDPIGFGLENFDAIGRFRTAENGHPIDASGEIMGEGLAASFVGPIELGQLLSSSPEVLRCFPLQWFRYALKRVETDADACVVDRLVLSHAQHGLRVDELISAITTTESFRYVGGAP